jgi:predicted ribosomally synthesized peptide with SipW-like signal peptide
LIGLGTVGVASVGAGVGTYAVLTDTEETETIITAGALDLIVHHESVYNGERADVVNAGKIDGTPGALYNLPDVKPGDSGRTRFCFELESNPAYLWLCGNLTRNAELGRTEPERAVDPTGGDPGEGAGELAEAIDVELKYADRSGNGSDTILEGTLRDVMDRLSTGVPLDAAGHEGVLDPGAQEPFDSGKDEPITEPCLVFEWSIDLSVGSEIQSDQVEFGLTIHAQQARHNDGTINPCRTHDQEKPDGDTDDASADDRSES